jgi:hypothetical protein
LVAAVFGLAVAGNSGSLVSGSHGFPNESGLGKGFVVSAACLGAAIGAFLSRRRGTRKLDVLSGGIAGAVAGLAGGATLGAIVPMVDALPGYILRKLAAVVGVETAASSGFWTPVWIMLVALCWGMMGGVLGGILAVLGDRGDRLMVGASGWAVWCVRILGLKRAAAYFRV